MILALCKQLTYKISAFVHALSFHYVKNQGCARTYWIVYLRSMSFSNIWVKRSLHSSLISAHTSWLNSSWSLIIFSNVSSWSTPWNGTLEEIRAKTMTPRLHTSALYSLGYSSATSGDINPTVPNRFVTNGWLSESLLASPKSAILTRGFKLSLLKKMFMCFMSLCTMLFSWMC